MMSLGDRFKSHKLLRVSHKFSFGQEPDMEKSEFKKEAYDLFEELNIHLEEETERSRKEKLEKEKAEILAYKEQLEALIKGAKLPRKEAWEKLLGIVWEPYGDRIVSNEE